jgi:hypothetical protein
MNEEEKKLEAFVNTIRFDDEPSAAHRDKLEKELLEAYDYEQKYGDYQEPVSVYFRKFAIAAGFLIVCGVLFWAIDSAVISPEEQFLAQNPHKEEIEQILVTEDVKGIEKKNLIAQFSEVWDMITDQDAESLVSVLQTSDVSYRVRVWGAKYLGKFGGEDTLVSLEEAIGQLHIDDPNDPLKIAAAKIRKRLNLPESPIEQAPQTEESDEPSMKAIE